MTSLVTGCLGFIGSHLCDALVARGDHVIGADLVTGSFEFFNPAVEFIPTDITKRESVEALCRKYEADVVYHTASIFNYSASKVVLDRVNLGGTQNFYEAIGKAKGWGGRLKTIVHWSSSSINGRQAHGKPAVEDEPWCPANDYERSKAEQETLASELAEQFQLPIVYLRPAGVYGPRSRYGLAKIIELVSKGLVRCYFGRPQARQSMVHVADVVGAAIHLADRGVPGEAYNVADDAQWTMGELTLHIARALKKWFVPLTLPVALIKPLSQLDERLARALKRDPLLIRDLLDHMERPFLVSNQKLKAAGYPLQFADTKCGLDHTIGWYREKGWL
ncbi:MAG: NAD(P)-dependent oxidoreductase [Deltaproteobacteria bacterium]|nr:NAD(P)-dependent oxidoreductase [Deltaproteobacteria bacterium]